MIKKKKKVCLLLKKLGTTDTVCWLILSPTKKKNGSGFLRDVKLLSELFGLNTSLFHKRWKCLNIF